MELGNPLWMWCFFLSFLPHIQMMALFFVMAVVSLECSTCDFRWVAKGPTFPQNLYNLIHFVSFCVLVVVVCMNMFFSFCGWMAISFHFPWAKRMIARFWRAVTIERRAATRNKLNGGVRKSLQWQGWHWCVSLGTLTPQLTQKFDSWESTSWDKRINVHRIALCSYFVHIVFIYVNDIFYRKGYGCSWACIV